MAAGARLSVVYDVLRQAAKDLSALHTDVAVVGGIAVSARTTPRTTNDVDLAVAVADERAAEKLVADMGARGNAVALVLENTATSRLSTVRFLSVVDKTTYVDLLFGSSGIESDVVAMADAVDLEPDLRLRVAQRGHLLALKVLSLSEKRAHKDQLDIDALLDDIDAADLARARSAAQMIVERGFGRGKDLLADLERQIAKIAKIEQR